VAPFSGLGCCLWLREETRRCIPLADMPKSLPSVWIAGRHVVKGMTLPIAVKELCSEQAVRGAVWLYFGLGMGRFTFGPYQKASAVEQGADKAKPPVRGGFIWFHVRTLGPYQLHLHLYGDRFRECETKD
jgi:hypothetical protein